MQRLGRYEILEELGRGAMGVVYRARDPKIDRIVAIKTIHIANAAAANQEAFRERFVREAQAAGKLAHRGIVMVYDVGEDEATQTPYIVMEYVAGQTLERLASGPERLPLDRVLDLANQIADALDYAHAHSVVHRDIKPANALVTADGQAKITDFGIAKGAVSHLTQTGEFLGTPSYMSPEQLNGTGADGRSDLFSLGVILYWMLTGEKPFAGENLTEITFKIAYKDPVPPSQRNPSVPSDFDYVLEHALAKDPARRYQRGREFADDLEDLKSGHPPRSRASFVPLVSTEPTLVRQTVAAPVPVASERTLPPVPLPAAAVESPLAAPLAHAGKKDRRLIVAGIVALLVLLLGGLWWWNRTPESPPPVAQQPAAQQPQAQQAPKPVPRRSPAPTRSRRDAEPAPPAQQGSQPTQTTGLPAEPQAEPQVEPPPPPDFPPPPEIVFPGSRVPGPPPGVGRGRGRGRGRGGF